MHAITRFFWFCSGASLSLLRRVPTESTKYAGIGATVFFTGVFAALAGYYALYTVFQSWGAAAFFGLLWGGMIFNLDRFIVSSMRKKEKSAGEWKMALPRFVLAIFLAMVISRPLELKLFEREINRELDEKKTEFIRQSKDSLAKGFPEIQALESEKKRVIDELLAAQTYRNRLQEEYDAERFGEKTANSSGRAGLGLYAKKKEEQLDAAQKVLDELRARNQGKVDEMDRQLQVLLALRQAEFDKQSPTIASYDGFAARMEGLAALTQKSSAMATAQVFLILLFVAIETAPIVVKLLSPRGPYDEVVELHEDKIKLYKNEKWEVVSGESASRLAYFRGTNAYATDLAIATTNSIRKEEGRSRSKKGTNLSPER